MVERVDEASTQFCRNNKTFILCQSRSCEWFVQSIDMIIRKDAQRSNCLDNCAVVPEIDIEHNIVGFVVHEHYCHHAPQGRTLALTGRRPTNFPFQNRVDHRSVSNALFCDAIGLLKG